MGRIQLYRFTKDGDESFLTAELRDKFLEDGFKEDHTWCDPYFVNQTAKGGNNENEQNVSGESRDEEKNASESGQSDGNGEVAAENQGTEKAQCAEAASRKESKIESRSGRDGLARLQRILR